MVDNTATQIDSGNNESAAKENDQLNVAFSFACPIYSIEKPEFLDAVNEVSNEALETAHKDRSLDEIYPVYMSGNYFDDPRMQEFSKYVGMTAWNILNEQGYAMQDKVVSFTEMWTQEHYKHSSMEQHMHGYGVQLVGFYFLEVPEDCTTRAVFYDPRVGKVMSELPEQDETQLTIASKMINFEPKPGLLMFANSWLAHSFTRNASDKPLKFVHFNLTAQYNPNYQAQCELTTPEVEVI